MRPKKSKNPSEPSTAEKILGHGIQILARHGLDRSSVQMIADAAGVSQTTVFHHFPNKELLIEAAILKGVSHCREMVANSIQPRDSAYERLVKYGDGNSQWAMSFPKEAQLVILLYYLAVFDGRFADFYARVRHGAQSTILETLYSGRREGLFRFEDEDLVQEFLHEAVMGAIINAIAAPEVPAEQRLKELKRKWRYAIAAVTDYRAEALGPGGRARGGSKRFK